MTKEQYTQQLIHEREKHVAKLFTKKEMLKRWKWLGYTPPTPVQLELFK